MLAENERLLDRPVTGSEFQKWPLVHGSFTLYKHHRLICEEGLLAPSQSEIRLNTRNEDILLGREKYVFTAPLRLKNGYGDDRFILIDPAVLSKLGVRCVLYDVFLLVRDIKNIASGLCIPPLFHSWISEPDQLRGLIEAVMKEVEATELSGDEDEHLLHAIIEDRTIKRFLPSEAFSRFWSDYEPALDDFFTIIADECVKRNMNLRGYAVRDHVWELSEEIMIPEQVEPQYLLGYWNGGNWEAWSKPRNTELSSSAGSVYFRTTIRD